MLSREGRSIISARRQRCNIIREIEKSSKKRVVQMLLFSDDTRVLPRDIGLTEVATF